MRLLFFLSSPYIALCFFLPWGVSGNFCTTKQVCGFWGVFILICIPGLNLNFILKFILNNGATNLLHHGSLWTTMHFHRDTWEVFRVLCICFHANICVCLYACVHTCLVSMLLVFLGLLFVTIISPNKEVEWVSVLYYFQLQTPYEMPRALHTSHRHKANLSSLSPAAIWVYNSLQPIDCSKSEPPPVQAVNVYWIVFFLFFFFFNQKGEHRIIIEQVLHLVCPPSLLLQSTVPLSQVFSQECGIPPPVHEPNSRFCKCCAKSIQTPVIYFSLVLFCELSAPPRFSFLHLWTDCFRSISHDTLFVFGQSCQCLYVYLRNGSFQ